MSNQIIKAPLKLVEPEKWPFHILITDCDGETVIRLDRASYSTRHASVADVMDGKGMGDWQDQAIAMNAKQRAMARRLVACWNALDGVPTEWLESYTAGGVSNLLQDKAVLAKALRFYADPSRYEGANQRPVEGDEFKVPGLPYRLDVTRDCGEIARAAIAEAGGQA